MAGSTRSLTLHRWIRPLPIAMCLAVGLLPGNAVTQQASGQRSGVQEGGGHPLRIVVAPTTVGRTDLSQAVASRVVGLLIARGHTVVDLDGAKAMARKVDNSVGAAQVRNGLQAHDMHIAERALGDVVIRVRLHPEFERKAQGRYRVRDTLHLSLSLVTDPQLIADHEVSLSGQSVESALDAHKQAIQKAFDATSDLPRQLAERLTKLRADERAKGAIYRVAVRTEGVDSAWLESASDGIAELDGVAPDTVRVQFGAKEFVQLSLRFRGSPRELRARLAKWARARAAESVEDAAAGTPAPGISMRSTGRHLEMTIEKRERSAEDEEAALQAMIDAAVERLHTANAKALDELLVTTLPAELDVDLAAAPLSTAESAQSTPAPTPPKPKPPAAVAPEPDDDPRPPLILPDAPVTQVAGASRAFELARAKKEFADELNRAVSSDQPTAVTGKEAKPIEVAGNRFPDLSAARKHLAKLNREFFATPVGEFAQSIGQRVAASLSALKSRKITQPPAKVAGEPTEPTEPTEQPASKTTVGQVVGSPAEAPSTLVAAEHRHALSKDEGPLDPRVTKALEAATQAEAGVRGAMVLTDLRPTEDEQIELSVSLVDLETGATTRDFTMIAGDLAQRIRQRLRGE